MDEPGLLTDQAATCRLLVHAHVCSDVPSLHLKCFLVQFLTENNTIMKKINFVHLPVCARTNMEKDQTPGPTTASLYQHMLETDLADMVARQDLQRELWERTGQIPITDSIEQKKWGWIAHTLRRQHPNIVR